MKDLSSGESTAILRALDRGWAWRVLRRRPRGVKVSWRILVSPEEQNDPDHFKRYKPPVGGEGLHPSGLANLPGEFFKVSTRTGFGS